MTVEASKPVLREQYTGPGNYQFNFTIFKDEELVVTYIDPDGSPLILRDGFDYNVLNFNTNGGNIDITYQAPTNTGIVDIRRKLPVVQETDYVNNSAFDMNILESDFDKIIMILQELDNKVAEQLSPFISRSDWQTSIHYFVGDVVIAPDESLYQCIVEHQSTQFNTDLNNGRWIILFDVSILKGYEQSAEQSKNLAYNYASSAYDSAVDSEHFRNESATFANNAENSKTGAESAKNGAEHAETEAEQAANASMEYRDQSEEYMDNSYDYSVYSEEYAIGTPPEGSSKYWASQAGAVVAGTATNKLINGNFDIWDYNTHQDVNGMKSADRWYFNAGGSTGIVRDINRINLKMANNYPIPPLCEKSILKDLLTFNSSVGADHYVLHHKEL
jgi:hypothetical protein